MKAGSLGSPLALARGAPVSGRVRAVDGRSPAAGALVRLEGRVATRWVETGKDGSFTIANAPAGVVTVEANAGEVVTFTGKLLDQFVNALAAIPVNPFVIFAAEVGINVRPELLVEEFIVIRWCDLLVSCHYEATGGIIGAR